MSDRGRARRIQEIYEKTQTKPMGHPKDQKAIEKNKEMAKNWDDDLISAIVNNVAYYDREGNGIPVGFLLEKFNIDERSPENVSKIERHLWFCIRMGFLVQDGGKIYLG